MGAIIVILILAVLPFFVDRGAIQSFFFVFTMLALAQYWNLLAGYAGLVSVGQQAFVGLGGYLLFALATFAGVDPVLAILFAGIIAAIVALPAAWLVFRLHGAYFAIGTWVLAEVFRLILAQVKPLGGGTGTSLSKSVAGGSIVVKAITVTTGMRSAAARDISAYWLALALALLATALAYWLLRSSRGLALAAVRDNQNAAASLGVDPFRLKLFAYVTAAFGTGMVGALIYLQKARISPDAAFSVIDWTANVLFIVVIGGVATIEGPFIGVLVLFGLQEELSGFGAVYLILLGAIAIIVMVAFPRGLWGSLSERWDLQLFPIRRHLEVENPRDRAKSEPKQAD
jgi:branched-chain amino acid transport system permease protein